MSIKMGYTIIYLGIGMGQNFRTPVIGWLILLQ